MQEDLEICAADFKDLVDKLDWAIAHKALMPLLVVAYGVAMEDIAGQIRETAIRALRDQEEGDVKSGY